MKIHNFQRRNFIKEVKDLPKESIFFHVLKFEELRNQRKGTYEMHEEVIGSFQEEIEKVVDQFPILYDKSINREIYVPKGWLKLWTELSEKIEEKNRELVKQGKNPYICYQVKEKFGSLRFYAYSPDNPEGQKELFNLIYSYEKKSRTICELTGKEGAFLCNCNGYLHTLTQESLDMIGGEKADQSLTEFFI